MSLNLTESVFEEAALAWFDELGYVVKNGLEVAPGESEAERESFSQVILTERLRERLTILNPAIPAAAIEDAIQQVLNPNLPSLIQSNRQFHRWLRDGVKVEFQRDGETVGDFVRLFDFDNPDNNDWTAINQFTVKGPHHTRRPDIIVFINGLPIALLELKNPADEDADIWKAFDQLQTYKEHIPDLFVTNELLVIADSVTARVGSLTSDKEWFMQWRTIEGEKIDPLGKLREAETLIRGLFQRNLLLDFLRNFILFEDDGEVVKKIAGYHQFHAVRKAVDSTIRAAAPAGDKKIGVVWHTQGSGKSISMCFYAGKIITAPEMKNPTLVVVTDRNELDGQLFGTFSQAHELLRETPVQAETRSQLRQLLDNRPSGGVIFTTIQKFSPFENEDKYPVLSERDNIVVICDEAHRTQYGMLARMEKQSGGVQYGYAKHMRDALKNASFVAFTGTPVSLTDRDTRGVFGDYIDIYDMEQAQADGATVPIYYESRLAKLELNEEETPKIDDEVEELTEDEEEAVQASIKSRWAALEKLVGAETRLKRVAADFVSHFTDRQASIEGKAMIVCMSREICAHLYNEIGALKPEWHDPDPKKGAIKIVMTGSSSDKPLLRPHIYSKQTKKELANRFKDPEDEFRVVIVRDMWLTGFDAPCLHTIYIDKPMRGHTLMQAIARVNRVFRDKPGGLVVDYLGIANDLRQALREYTQSGGDGDPVSDAAEKAVPLLIEKIEVARGMLHGFDYSDFETDAYELLPGAADHILGLSQDSRGRDGKQRFSDCVAALTKAFALCCTLDEALIYREEVAFFQAIKAALNKHSSATKKISDEQREYALRQIVSRAVFSDGVVDIFAAAGLKKPNIGILSEEFLNDVRLMPQRNLAVELLERLLDDEIKSRFATNVVQNKKFSELLQQSLTRYRNRAIETAQVIEELIAMAKQFNEAARRGEDLRLNDAELAFYDALETNEASVRELGDDVLRKIAVELTDSLQKSVTVDWSVRETVRARLRLMVRRILRKYKYPPDKEARAIELVLQQAETLSEAWTS